MVFQGRGGTLCILECWEGVVCRPGTYPSCPLWGTALWEGPPLVLERVVAYLGTQGQ